jgi:hypothetical protein
MVNEKSEELLSKFLLIGPAFVTVLVFTTGVTDPVNANKFFAIGVLSAGMIAIPSSSMFRLIWQEHKLLTLAFCGFLIASFNSLIQSEAPLTQQLYGIYGRNNGFILYLSLSLIFIATITLNKLSTARMILKSLVIAGMINLLYCAWVLAFGDFIGWSNPYGNILGTLGNPNFIGAFLGMFSSVVVSFAISNRQNPKILLISVLTFAITAFEIFQSHAIQGRVLLILGLAINAFYAIRARFRNRTPLIIFSLGSAIGGVFGLLGTLQIGPLAGMLYKESVSLRGEYWNAGLKMAINHLFTGVGFDSYGDWYRYSRRASALVKPGPETVSNTAHNVVIDVFAFGGLPLLLSYLVIIGFVIFAIVSHSRRIREFDSIFVGLVAAWICYQVQSIISINQIGLAIWGWILGAAIIAYDRIGRNSPQQIKSQKDKKSNRLPMHQIVSPALRAAVAMILGIFIAIPPFSADVTLRGAQESRDAARVELALDSSYFNPSNSTKYLLLAGALEESNLTDLSIRYAREAIKFNPRSYDAWRLFTMLRNATPQEKQIAIQRMRELDPKNTNSEIEVK